MSCLPVGHVESGRPREKFQDFRRLWQRLVGEAKTLNMTTLAGAAGNDSDDQDTFKKRDSKIYKYDGVNDKENEGAKRKRVKDSFVKPKFQYSSKTDKQVNRTTTHKKVKSTFQIPIAKSLEQAALSHAVSNCLVVGARRPSFHLIERIQQLDGICAKEDQGHLNDIISYLKKREIPLAFDDLLENQVEVTSRVRSILVDWLIQVQNYLCIGTNTLQLTVTLLDLCLSRAEISLSEIQLLGITCLLIAAKFYERFAPEIAKLIRLTDHTYTYREVILMELRVLKSLGYDINFPTPDDYLKVFLNLAEPDEQVENLSRYLIDLSLADVQCSGFKPSHLTAGAIYTANRLIRSANDAMVASTVILPPAKSITGMQRRNSRKVKGSVHREQAVEITTGNSRRMSCTMSETASSRRISVVLDNGDGRSLSVTMEDDIAHGKRRISVTAMDCDEDVFSCESTLWNNQLNYFAGYSEAELIPVANRLTSLLADINTSQLQGAKKKYASRKKFNAISEWVGLKKPALASLRMPAICRGKSDEFY